MNRINRTYTDQHFPQSANEPKKEIPFALAQTATTAALIYLHECGHALGAMLLYKNANPEITISFPGGNCSFSDTHLSGLGNWCGRSTSSALVASAGPIVDIISMLAITKLTRSDKRAAELMSMKAFNLSLYALSAFWTCHEAHDFCKVWTHGGKVAYGLLTACSLATTALVFHNATKKENKPEMRTRKITVRN